LPGDFLQEIVHENYLKSVCEDYRKIISENKVRKSTLTIKRGGEINIEYNKSGYVTSIINSNIFFPRYNFYYDDNNNVTSLVNTFGANDTVILNCYYQNNRCLNMDARNTNNPRVLLIKFEYDSLGRFYEDKTFVPEVQDYVSDRRADYDSTGRLTGFFSQAGVKYYTISCDSASFSCYESGQMLYKCTYSENKIRKIAMGNRVVDYFYKENGLIDYTILHENTGDIRTDYTYEFY
jgi:hypothetical protein